MDIVATREEMIEALVLLHAESKGDPEDLDMDIIESASVLMYSDIVLALNQVKANGNR